MANKKVRKVMGPRAVSFVERMGAFADGMFEKEMERADDVQKRMFCDASKDVMYICKDKYGFDCVTALVLFLTLACELFKTILDEDTE